MTTARTPYLFVMDSVSSVFPAYVMSCCKVQIAGTYSLSQKKLCQCNFWI